MADLTDRQVRAWLTLYYHPNALADPVMRDLLRAHGRAWRGSDQIVTDDARRFLRDMIDRALLPRPEAPEHIWRPYRALVLRFLEGHSHLTVARLLAVSSRTLTRVMARAVRRLRETLEKP